MSNPVFFERLTPGISTVLALSLSAPMVFLAALPISFELAILLLVAVPTALISASFLLAPTIKLDGDHLFVGKMKLPRSVLGTAEAFSKDEARFQRGPGLSPGTQRLFRGDIDSVVKIKIEDPKDPTDFVLFSSRKAQELVSALDADRA